MNEKIAKINCLPYKVDRLNNLNSSPEMLDDNIFPIPKPAKEI